LKGKDKDTWGVLAHGHSLFLAEVVLSSGNSIQLYSEERKKLQRQKNGCHVHSFYSLSRGELYTLIALYMNILLIILLNYEKLIERLGKISEFVINSFKDFFSSFL